MMGETHKRIATWVFRLVMASGIALIAYHSSAFNDLFFLLSMR